MNNGTHLRVVAIIQARMGSTRLPGKALIDIDGTPMLFRVVNRLQRCKNLDEIVVATTKEESDDLLELACDEREVKCIRGSTDDVLDRYHQAATYFHADVVVRITSDCPLIDPELVDLLVKLFLDSNGRLDYVSNVVAPRTYPRGLDAEVLSSKALHKAWKEDDNPNLREHVTQYILRNPARFKIVGVFNDQDLSYMRWTVDTLQDLSFVRCVLMLLKDDDFSWKDLIDHLKNHPELLSINKMVEQKKVDYSIDSK